MKRNVPRALSVPNWTGTFKCEQIWRVITRRLLPFGMEPRSAGSKPRDVVPSSRLRDRQQRLIGRTHVLIDRIQQNGR